MRSNDNESDKRVLMKKQNATTYIEEKIGIIMRIGVGVAAAFMIAGFVLLLINYKENFAGFPEISLITI